MQAPPLDAQQVGHIARLALLAMCARAVACSEFEASPAIRSIHLTVSRSDGPEPSAELCFEDDKGLIVGGVAL